MRFALVDRIESWVPRQEMVAVKNLTLAEEYLAEHFPTFPLMPGVLMVEALTQTGAWLVQASDEFRWSMVFLREVRNAKFGQMVTPGRQLRLRCEWVKDDGRMTTLKGVGEVDGKQAVSARLVLERFCLKESEPSLAEEDEAIQLDRKRVFGRLTLRMDRALGRKSASGD